MAQGMIVSKTSLFFPGIVPTQSSEGLVESSEDLAARVRLGFMRRIRVRRVVIDIGRRCITIIAHVAGAEGDSVNRLRADYRHYARALVPGHLRIDLIIRPFGKEFDAEEVEWRLG
jgi:hypothetical protein